MKQQTTQVILFAVLSFIYACGQDNAPIGIAAYDEPQYAVAEAQADIAGPVEIARKLIKRGDIRFETANVIETRQYITKLVAESNGYISSDNVYDYNDRQQHHLSIRVPADMFDLFLAKIEDKAGDLEHKSINVQDVTEEFIDVQARIDVKKQLEARYRELLKEANKVGDILNIEKEMGILRSEIESIEGRLKYLQDNVAMSSLEVSFYQKSSFGNSFASKVGDAVHTGWDNFLWFLIAVANLWPFVLIIVIALLIVRRYRKRKKKAKINH